MRLVFIFAAILAVSFAETNDQSIYDDLVAMETMELKKESSDLTPAASVYNYVPSGQRPTQWNQPQNYVPPQTWTPPKPDPIQPIHTHVPSPVNHPYVPPSPVNIPYVPPVTASPPYIPPVQSDYVPPHYHVPSTTPSIPVIKNEQHYWDDGSYRYEYQIADGTHVGEEGYFTDPKGTDESLVKKGWYSYLGPDGKTYTVTYWADHTGYHAYGAHLPTPPPVPAAIQAALDKEEAEKNKRPITYPPVTQKPYYPTQQTYYPPQQTYYPPQQTYYPQQSGAGKK